MAPIPVYTNSPVVAAKPDGVTPRTAALDASHSKNQTAPAATTTSQSSYPQAQPGAVPSLPVQTMAPQAQAPPLQATPTQPMSTQGPPAPQPGAAPTLAGLTSHLPPPPKAGEKYVPPPPPTTSQAAASAPYPQQMGIPPPTMAYPAQQLGTATAVAPSSAYAQAPSGSVGQPGGQSSLDHPPGYHQNVNAAGLDQYQRQAIARNESADRRQQDGSEEEGIWGAAKKWAAGAGEKLAAAESEVWKRVTKE
ncbi:hypothetical protein PG999_006361 [Apiospora kogelbergensis]|uniref:Uncharacterized protein n=1 Tax=Apiospora kogelbergensis TaxID=1337665 RepID=A0AAW0QUE2_9PEZI